MRLSTKVLLTAALVVPTAMTVVGTGGGVAGAAGGTSCTKSSGLAVFKPALPVAGSSQTVKPTVTVNNGTVGGCTGGGVTSGTFVSVSKFHDATNCTKLLNGQNGPNPPTGTIKTTWNTGQTSSGTVTLNPVSGQPTETHVTGKVTAGKFVGKHLSVTLSFTPKRGDCINTPLKSVTFKIATGKLTIS